MLFGLAFGQSLSVAQDAPEQSLIPAGTYAPFYPATAGETIAIASFRIDSAPVTNAEYLAFVRANPRWQRGRAPSALVDERYLQSWAAPQDLGDLPPDAPVPVKTVL